MSKAYFFMNATPAPRSGARLPDVYCPTGGYFDKNLGQHFSSRGAKFRYLRSHGMREAEVFNPEKSLGGTNGCSYQRRGSRGNFQSRPTPAGICPSPVNRKESR